HNVANL
ncbi:hypothetical protein EC950183_2905, partial [Escherichia coli 95.0183]